MLPLAVRRALSPVVFGAARGRAPSFNEDAEADDVFMVFGFVRAQSGPREEDTSRARFRLLLLPLLFIAVRCQTTQEKRKES